MKETSYTRQWCNILCAFAQSDASRDGQCKQVLYKYFKERSVGDTKDGEAMLWMRQKQTEPSRRRSRASSSRPPGFLRSRIWLVRHHLAPGRHPSTRRSASSRQKQSEPSRRAEHGSRRAFARPAVRQVPGGAADVPKQCLGSKPSPVCD